MESGMEKQQYIIVSFEKNNINEQTDDASTCDIMKVTERYCRIGGKFYSEVRILIMVLKIIMRLLKRLSSLIKIVMDCLIILNHI